MMHTIYQILMNID